MILLFAAKRVGFEALKLLLDRQAPVARVVCASAEDQPILDLCRKAALPCDVYSPQILADIVAAGIRYDWLINAWSGHILREPVLSLADHRANLHPSLVPHARGSDSWAWILRKGLPAGVSILEMTAGIDAGGLYAQSRVDVDFPMTGSELREKLQNEMISLFRDAWPKMATGEIVARPQEPGGSYHVRKDTNLDRVRDAASTMSLGEFVQWALAHDFSPGTTAEMTLGAARYRIRVLVEKIARKT